MHPFSVAAWVRNPALLSVILSLFDLCRYVGYIAVAVLVILGQIQAVARLSVCPTYKVVEAA